MNGLPGFKSGGAITQWRIVKLTAADTVSQSSAATDRHLSVAKTSATGANEHVDVADVGEVVYVEAGAAVSAGADITSDANGRGVTAAPAAGTNNGIIGKALSAAGAAGELMRVLMVPSTLQG